jgi:hypothetical protein
MIKASGAGQAGLATSWHLRQRGRRLAPLIAQRVIHDAPVGNDDRDDFSQEDSKLAS